MWRGAVSLDQYTGPLVAFPLAWPLLRDEALKQGRWRQTPEGHIEKGPFPAEKTSVNVTPLGTSRETGDLIMMGIGGFTPLTGFMGQADWKGVCENMQLASGVFWPIPITLSVDTATADGIAEGDDIVLIDPETEQASGETGGAPHGGGT